MNQLGQRGARTSETKTWQGQILKPLYLSIGIGICLSIFICLVTFGIWLCYPTTEYWLQENFNLWLCLHIISGIVAILELYSEWSRELHDEDYTSLQANHPLRGIVPMRRMTRWLIVVLWLAKQWKPEPGIHPTIKVDDDGTQR